MTQAPSPGRERAARIDDEGLQRLERQLQAGAAIAPLVLAQWIRRYGDAAREILLRHGISMPYDQQGRVAAATKPGSKE